MADDFRDPDYDAPLDVAARIASARPGSSVKGMYFQSIVDQASAAAGRPIRAERYVGSQAYPMAEWIETLVECAAIAHPDVSPREGMRRLAREAYTTFAESTIGQVLISIAGIRLEDTFRLIPRMYDASGDAGRARIGRITPHRVIVHLRNTPDFPEAWHLGTFEGGLRAFEKTGRVRVRGLSLADVDFEITWQ